jgi:lipoprotein signal peptidase
MTAIDANPRLRALLLEGPELSGLPTRQLATALRLAYGGVDAEAVAARPLAPEPAAPAVLPAGETSVFAAPATAATAAAARPAARPITVSATTTALVSGGVFLVDRVVKLAATGALQAPARVDIAGAIQLGIPAANALSNTFVTDVFALGAELFGIALALLIMTFWGAARPQKSYSVAFGLILGALAANLFDRLAYGGVLNFIRIADSPVFNVSHVALLAGALLLAFSVLRNTVARPQESAA